MDYLKLREDPLSTAPSDRLQYKDLHLNEDAKKSRANIIERENRQAGLSFQWTDVQNRVLHQPHHPLPSMVKFFQTPPEERKSTFKQLTTVIEENERAARVEYEANHQETLDAKILSMPTEAERLELTASLTG